MNVTYANQVTLTKTSNEAILHFAFLTPQYDVTGSILEEPAVSQEQTIVMSLSALEGLKDILNNTSGG